MKNGKAARPSVIIPEKLQFTCSVIRGKLKEDSKFRYKICANQQTDMAEDSPDIALSGQSL